jgi:hypothetical protein
MPSKPAISTTEITELLTAEPDPDFRRAEILLTFCARIRFPTLIGRPRSSRVNARKVRCR